MSTSDSPTPPSYVLPDEVTHTIAGLRSLGQLPDEAVRVGDALEWAGKGYATRVEVTALASEDGVRRSEVRMVSRLTEPTLPALDTAALHLVNTHAGPGALRRRADGGLEMAAAALVDRSDVQYVAAWQMMIGGVARVLGEAGLALIYCTLVDPSMTEAWRTRLGFPHAWQDRPGFGELEAAHRIMTRYGYPTRVDAESVLVQFTVPMAAKARAAGVGGGRPESVVQVGLGPGHVHPLFGPGYRVHADTTLPGTWTWDQTAAFAEALNESEQQRPGWWVPRLGAWRASGAGTIAYEGRVGTEVPWPGMVERLAEGMVERVGWVEQVVKMRG